MAASRLAGLGFAGYAYRLYGPTLPLGVLPVRFSLFPAVLPRAHSWCGAHGRSSELHGRRQPRLIIGVP